MNLFQLSIALNNEAVTRLDAPCHYPAALSQLKQALSTLKQTMQMPLPQITSYNARCCQIAINDCMCKSMASPQHHDDQMHFLHQDAIQIPTELGVSPGFRERSMASCMIIFNLALAHHLSAIGATGSNPSSDLRRALKLYELAFNLQKEELGEVNVLFVLAVTNNVGMVHRELGDEEPATECFETVLSTLMYLADQHQVNSFPLDGYFINTRYLISRESVAPAA